MPVNKFDSIRPYEDPHKQQWISTDRLGLLQTETGPRNEGGMYGIDS